jgi:DNA polymerase (family 10)
LENVDIARTLSETADLLELAEGNPFKVRAYRRAAQLVELLPEPVASLIAQGKLAELPGIGPSIADHIQELQRTGTFREHDQLASGLPHGLLDLLRIEGVGPKTVAVVWKRLGVTDLQGLEACCVDGRLAGLPRLGPRRAAAILKAVQRLRGRQGRVPLHQGLSSAEALVAHLRGKPGVVEAQVAGSVRRRKETVGDIDLLVSSEGPDLVWKALRSGPEVEATLATGPTKTTVRLRSGLPVDVRVVPPESFGAALHYFTGSKTHNIAIRTRAVHRGLKLSEYGIFDRQGRRIGGATEEEVFRAVGLPWIPPELREDTGEIEAAEAGTLPRLIEEEDLQGDLHVHSSDSSDAYSTLEELAASGARLGRRYLAITDHSRSRPLGLNAEAVLTQASAIRRLDRARRGKPHLLAGVEVDILADGLLDLPEDVLSTLDCVVASVHSRFAQPRGEMTERVVRALRSGSVHILGHPTGRQLGVRDAYDLDLETVLDVAKREEVAVEINAMPERMDLGAEASRQAKKAGVPLVISTDSHHESQLGNLRYGVWMARRGWLEKRDVLNTLPFDQLRRRLFHPRGMVTAAPEPRSP